MSRIGLTATVLTLISATAASACCFFKCCFKSSSSERTVVFPVTTASTVRIIDVDAQSPVLNDIPSDVSHPRAEVTVESDIDPGTAGPDLYVTDDGPRTAAVAPTAAAAPKKYRARRVEKLPRPKTAMAPAPGPSPAPGPIPDPAFIWRAVYTIDLDANHKYRAYASVLTVTSSTVTFRTGP